MAAATISIEEDQFCCSVCLEVLRDPVTIPCGHSYCLACIQDYWNRAKQRGQCSCPQCRQVFHPRPLLSRNTVLGEVVEKFQASTQKSTKAEEGKCSVCTKGKKSGGGGGGRGVKPCPVCPVCPESNFCAPHLRVHVERVHAKAHEPNPSPCPCPAPAEEPREKLCPQHDKPLRLFCRTDQRSVCSRCVRGRHKGHEAVPLGDERTAQQKKLQEASLKSAQRLKDTEKELRYTIRNIKHSTEAVVEESERIFSRLIRSIEKKSSEATELIRLQERAAVGQAEELLEKLQREMSELRRTDAELEKLCRAEDHVHFIQKSKSFNFPTKTVEMPNTDAPTYVMYKTTRGALVELKDNVDETLEREFDRISEKVNSLKEICNQRTSEKTKAKSADAAFNSEPKTRDDFLQYYNDITLDPNTANPYLCFSEGRRGVSTRLEPQPYADHPDRFSSWAQVLCRAGMAGRCYWEVEWAGKGGVSVGVCYKSMSRGGGGSDSKLGHNAKSWSLDCSSSACSFQHNKESVSVAGATGCSRIGVFLDLRGGTLSFYHVSDTMVLLHTVKTTFTQPVYPGFWVGLGSTLKLCSP